MGTLRRLLSTGSTARPHIVISEAGVGIRASGSSESEAEVRIAWDAVVEVRAYKRNLLTRDLICLSISTAAGPRLEVDEELAGWDELLAVLPARLSGALPRDQVLSQVTQPPFATRETVVYARPRR